MILGGRGSGKTRAGAEWVRNRALGEGAPRLAAGSPRPLGSPLAGQGSRKAQRETRIALVGKTIMIGMNTQQSRHALDHDVAHIVVRLQRRRAWPEGYEYTVGGRSVRFIDEPVAGVRPILHVRMFHPVNDHYGMSPIEAASVAIDIHNTASGWNKALLDNSARPSGALVYAASNGQMTEEQFARLCVHRCGLEAIVSGAREGEPCGGRCGAVVAAAHARWR